MDENKLMNMALDAGEIMIGAGAETHRVEDTVERLLSTGDNAHVQALALSTMLIISAQKNDGGSMTLSRGVKNRTIDFFKIGKINAVSRKYIEGRITLEEAYGKIVRTRNAPGFSPFWVTLSYGLVTGGFALLLKANFLDAIGAFIGGILLGLLKRLFMKTKTPYFLSTLISGLFVAFFALVFYHLFYRFQVQYDLIIVGLIMPLLPGVTMTNALRDMMEGNYLSGTSKIMEALLFTVSIATGVGIVLSIYNAWF